MTTRWTAGPWHSPLGHVGIYVENGGEWLGTTAFLGEERKEERRANVVLLAASPELYDALAELLDACPSSCDDRRLNEAQRMAEAAMRKAKGK